MLFMPWRSEDVELIAGFATFADSYNAHLESIEPVQQIFASNSRAVDNAVDLMQNLADVESAWDSVAPGARAEAAECDAEGTEQVTDYDAIEVLAPGQQTWNERQPLSERFRTEDISNVMSNEDYCRAVRSLTSMQLEAVMFNRRWIKRFVASVNRGLPEPEPYFVFLSGPGGVGKSHVIRLIHTDCIKLLRHSRRNGTEYYDADDVMVLLTAPTGTAAFNISGLTIHSALCLNDLQGGKLSAENLNSLRNALGKLTVLIIDEVSMVGAPMMAQVDRRLRQIKSTDKLFGGVCVLAVGDL
jgi:DNA replication protein DnaC